VKRCRSNEGWTADRAPSTATLAVNEQVDVDDHDAIDEGL
jgi:hypothetical protein